MEAQIAQLDGGDDELTCAGVLHYAACHPGTVESGVLFRAIGSAGFANRKLAGNVAEVACALYALEGNRHTPHDVDLPEPQNGWSPDEFDAAVVHVGRKTPRAFETLVCELRRHEAERRYRISAAAPPAVAWSKADCAALLEVLVKLAPQCKFERTGDWYIQAAVRAMLPAVAVADLATNEAPFRLVSEHLGRSESNEAVGRLFRTRVETLLQEETRPLSPVLLFLAAAVIAEFCDFDTPPPVYSNIDVGDTDLGVVLYANFDGGAGHDCAVTIKQKHTAGLHSSALEALLAWVAEDPRAQDMWTAVHDPKALEPDCAISKILATAENDVAARDSDDD